VCIEEVGCKLVLLQPLYAGYIVRHHLLTQVQGVVAV
jgi:hypothetical protein